MSERSPTPALAVTASTRLGLIGSRTPPRTIVDLLAPPIRDAADAPAILAPDRAPLTFAGLGRMMRSVAATLAGAGYGRGARIAVALPAGPECAVAILAVCGCATCAPINSEPDEQTLSHLLTAMRIDALMAPAGDRSRVVCAAQRSGVAILELEVAGDAYAGEFTLAIGTRRPAVAIEPPRVGDVALVSHTSGTTSLPKIVPLAQHAVAEAARAYADIRSIGAHDRVLLLAPLYSIPGLCRNLIPALMVGGSAVCPPGLDAARFVEWLDRYRPTHYFGAAAQHLAILDILESHAAPVRHCLRFVFSGATMLPTAAVERLERILGVPVLEGYGMTETGSIAQTLPPPAHSPRGSVGRASNAEVAIMDADGHHLAADETGEIVVRGSEVFDGYEGDPQADAEAFRAGWFRTGDLGRIDRDGFIFIAGRLKDLINRGGTKIAPSVVEDALTRHAQVLEAAAYGVPHPTLGEDVSAVVILRRGASATEAELRDFARARLAAFLVPTRVIAVPSIPRGALGKVKRGELAALAARHDPIKRVAARDPGEALVLGVFADVLGRDDIGVDDNFFQLGGDSMTCARARARIAASCGVELPVNAVFLQPTAAALAACLRAANDPARRVATPIDTQIRPRSSRARRALPTPGEPQRE